MKDVAEVVGFHTSNYWHAETDKDRDFTAKQYVALADFFRVSTDYLLGRTKYELGRVGVDTLTIDRMLADAKYKSEIQKEVFKLIAELDDADLETIKTVVNSISAKTKRLQEKETA